MQVLAPRNVLPRAIKFNMYFNHPILYETFMDRREHQRKAKGNPLGEDMSHCMENPFDCIRKMAYPGRLIVLGASPEGHRVALYAITGRSPSSQARKLEIDPSHTKIIVRPTDEKLLRTGMPDLLVYPAVICGQGIAISNGKQTETVFSHLTDDSHPVDVLVAALRIWDYEPDGPNFTPRISGCITSRGAALSIIKRAADGSSMRFFFEVPLIEGAGKVIATYTGENTIPLPSFTGEPYDIAFPWSTPESACRALYEALAPLGDGADFRVAVAAVFSNGGIAMQVQNRHQ